MSRSKKKSHRIIIGIEL